MKKTAIVTGSSRGIGFAIAKQLGLDGYNIVMVATGPQEKNQAALDELKTQGIDCAYVQANIGSADDRKKILDGALAAFGRVDVLVNNAGVAPKVRADLLDMSEESFDYVVGINTKGNMFLTQLVAKQMISQEPVDGRKGVIVNVSSCSSVVSSTNRGEYCVSKAGISMLTTLYADRLASEGILVNEVRPGVIATDMTSKVQGKYDALIEKGTFPIARWGTPERTAVCMLADKEAIGSEGVSGMKSRAFDTFMEDLCQSQSVPLRACYEKSFCLSADVTAAYDPNFAEVYEKRNSAFVNYGMGLCKYTGARGKSGASDASAELVAYVRRVLDGAGVVWQMAELGKADQGGGGTVAVFMAERNIDTLDAGVPVLSMHAPFETVSKLDCYMTYKGMKAIYEAV